MLQVLDRCFYFSLISYIDLVYDCVFISIDIALMKRLTISNHMSKSFLYFLDKLRAGTASPILFGANDNQQGGAV